MATPDLPILTHEQVVVLSQSAVTQIDLHGETGAADLPAKEVIAMALMLASAGLVHCRPEGLGAVVAASATKSKR
jgi:hypothetical protein